MKRVLVTGASGQLGMSLKDIHKDFQELEFVFKDRSELDIISRDQVKDIFSSGNFDFCINCAAYTDVEQAEKTPAIAYKINAEGVKNMALACKEYNVVFIHISTDYVFDGEKGLPYTVDDLPNPINEYGKSKREGERHIQEILKQYYIVRTSWLYHKEHGKNFYKTILKKAEKGETIYVTDEQVGCPTNAANLAQFILGLISLEDSNYGIIHYTDGEAMTWYDFSKKIIAENNFSSVATVVRDNNYRSFAARPKNSVLSLQ
ncbi:dTDP-4-dehydrorhamnose reductase [Sediminicola sp. YIK13]|uniref:dTDP-4-dehydrorhamnose reductase n=1 Tax=Sediminicola sp. YIK13 TaxID=1453352 RepID=UPI00072134F7|nr:dTDP-4-dehydrorhamnose reductase [Sediminicola sp. YIK13]ALM08453.1 dTDP-4-dehydrorhamnose reductase [Sediminicola sp. YIK13]